MGLVLHEHSHFGHSHGHSHGHHDHNHDHEAASSASGADDGECLQQLQKLCLLKKWDFYRRS